MLGTITLPCTCKHDFQDKTYGRQMRLHNISGNKDKPEAFCTVCSPRQPKRKDEVIATPKNPFGMIYSVSRDPSRQGKSISRSQIAA